ncbi:hypothetical protein OH76DRAFT_1224226 [Lentinus brumalis]|uniref:Uncharacterized protein n=1 Tax=Lentinus brumalis TaxID=2498619 RepID=A0A371DLS9_9APHY|nr:hypothetical protein OH76DRAFT_1224226 [Polyporus brumalis]
MRASLLDGSFAAFAFSPLPRVGRRSGGSWGLRCWQAVVASRRPRLRISQAIARNIGKRVPRPVPPGRVVAASAVGRRVNCRVLPRVDSRIYAPFARARPSVLGFRPRRSRLTQAPDAQRRPIRSCLRPEYAVGIEHVGGSKCTTVYPTFCTTHSSPVTIPSLHAPYKQQHRLQPGGQIRHRTLRLPSSSTTAEDRCLSQVCNPSSHAQRAMTKLNPLQGTS